MKLNDFCQDVTRRACCKCVMDRAYFSKPAEIKSPTTKLRLERSEEKSASRKKKKRLSRSPLVTKPETIK